MVIVDTVRAKTIDDYLKDHGDKAKTNRTVPVELEGVQDVLPAYRLPIKDLLYNKENGRLAANVVKYEDAVGEIDTATDNGRRILEEMLLALDAKRSEALLNDIKRVGQTNPGIITHDGIVINGNRRMAVLSKLYEASAGREKFGFLLAARLPANVSEKDIFRIEAKLQFSKSFQEDYKPVNVLMTIRKGLEFYKKERMANDVLMLPGGVKELNHKLSVLECIENYLEQIGKTNHYYIIQDEKTYAHFDEVVKLMEAVENKRSPTEMAELINHAFMMIKTGCAHKEIRGLKEFGRVYDDRLRKWLSEARDRIDLKKPLKEISAQNRELFRDETFLAIQDAKTSAKGDPFWEHVRLATRHVESLDPGESEMDGEKMMKELENLIEIIREKIKTIGKLAGAKKQKPNATNK